MPRRLRKVVAGSLRYKLLLLVLFPILVVLPTVVGLTIYWSLNYTYDQLYAKVRTDLLVADDVFKRLQQDYLSQLEGLAKSYSFRTALELGDRAAVDELIAVILNTTHFDYLRVINIEEGLGPNRLEDPFRASTPSPLLDDAYRFTKPGVGVQIFHNEDIKVIDPALAKRIELKLVDTPYAEPTTRVRENRAMVVRAVYPVRDNAGQLVALLDGGVLLNNNFTLVDDIRDLVYGPGSVPDEGWGTVTVFLDDVRISTNVPLSREQRALGTRVSEEVRKHVLGEGKVWVDSAFVVNDWYVSAYKPIEDVYGDRVGMLYAGILEAPYTAAYTRAVSILIAVIAITALIAGWLAIRGAKSVFKPMEAMAQAVRATREGVNVRVGPVESQDEIGELARQFDVMLDQLQEHNRQMEIAADQLEVKVAERTHELTMKNIRLQQTINMLREARQQLSIAGKLAALGELTAGVAHEINNPTAVILGNMDVLIRELGDNAEGVSTETDLIIEQVYRIRSIVDKLLRYARPSEFAGYVDDLDVQKVIDETLTLVHHEIYKRNADIRREYSATKTVRFNRQELQQVLVNLFLNALQAIDIGGRIDIKTEDTDDGINIVVHDFGKGIALEELGRVFDPFFTKREDGTGLGLSVSYGLVRRYGGTLSVQSEQGRYTQFTLHILQEPVYEKSEEDLVERYAANTA